MLQGGPYDSGARQEFAAAPRVVNAHRKYKDPYGTDSEYVPQNIMFDKRIARGSTHAAMVIPGGTHPDTLLFERQKKMKRKQKTAADMGGQEMPVRRIIRTPEPPEGRHNIDIQTEQFVEQLTDKPPEYETGCQTDFYIDRPPTPLFDPHKRREDDEVADAGTQVGDNDLFDFDEEVEPILAVLCSKTLEQSRMQVLEEEELRVMQQQQREFEQTRNNELAEAQRLEQEELRRKQEKDRRILQMRKRKEERVNLHQKLVSRAIAKRLLRNLKPSTQKLLMGQGFFRPTLETKLNTVLFPYIFNKTKEFVKEAQNRNNFLQGMMEEALMMAQNKHAAVLKNANQKKEELKQRKIQEEIEKEKEKKRKAEEKARKKRERELMELRKMLSTEIIEKGETQEGAVKHRFTNSLGDFQAAPGVGVLGGVLFQFALALESFVTDKPVLSDSLKDKEAALKLFCDWLRSEQRVKVQILKPTAEINQLLADRELEAQKLPEVPNEDLMPLYFNRDRLLELVRDPEQHFNVNTQLLQNILDAAVALERQPADTKEELYAGAREHVAGVELPAQFQEIDPAAVLRVRIPLKRPETSGTQAVSAAGGDATSAAAPPTSAGPDGGEEAKEGGGSGDKSKPISRKVSQEGLGEIQEVKDQVLLTRAYNSESGVAAHVIHQYGSRMLRLNVLKFLVAKYADQIIEGESVEDFAKKAEKKEQEVEKRLLEGLGVPHFDIELN